MASYDLDKTINELTARINSTKSLLNPNLATPVIPSVNPHSTTNALGTTNEVPDVAAILRGIVAEEIDKRLNMVTNGVTSPPPSEPMDYGSKLLYAIGSGLTEEQQLWLSSPDNQACIPDFLLTPDGQAFTKRFFLYYREYKEHKCK